MCRFPILQLSIFTIIDGICIKIFSITFYEANPDIVVLGTAISKKST